MVIRPATWLDSMNIAVMWLKMHQEITKRKALLEENSDAKSLFAQIFSRVDNPDWTILVAEEGTNTIGFIMGRVRFPAYSKCHIVGSCEALYVEPDHRNKGIYKELVSEIARIGKEKGAREIEFVCTYDKRVVDFYDKLGYEPIQVVLRQKEV